MIKAKLWTSLEMYTDKNRGQGGEMTALKVASPLRLDRGFILVGGVCTFFLTMTLSRNMRLGGEMTEERQMTYERGLPVRARGGETVDRLLRERGGG